MLRTSHYTVDRDFIIGDVSDTAHPCTKLAEGEVLFDAFPGLDEAGMSVLFEDAWENGCASRVIFYAGTLAHVAATQTCDRPGVLSVTAASLPVAGLRAAVEAALEWLSSGHATVR